LKLKKLKNIYVLTTFVFLISIIVTIATVSLGTRGNTIDALELGLYRLDVARSTMLWLTNQFLWFIIVVVLFAAFMLYIYRRKLRPLKEDSKKIALFTLILMITSFMLISPSLFCEVISDELGRPLVEHVFLITFDGTNVIDFWQNTPFISSLLNESTKAEAFATVFPTITYPAHTSLVTGTYPQIHGITSNEKGVVKEEDIFELAAQYGFTTCIVGGTFMDMFGNASQTEYHLGWNSSEGFMDTALSILRWQQPDLMFIYQPDPDEVGHAYGSESIEYKAAIRGSDAQIGRLVNYLKEAGFANNSCIFVTADHGMAGRSHYNRFPPLVINVPLWMWGPCFKHDGTIRAARIIDIAPTIAVILGLPNPADSLGIPIWDALNETYYEKVRGGPAGLKSLRMNDLKFARSSLSLDVAKLISINGVMFFVTALALVAVWDQRRKFIKLKKRQI